MRFLRHWKVQEMGPLDAPKKPEAFDLNKK